VAAVRALAAGEAGGEVAAAEKGLDGGDGGGVERAEGFAVVFLLLRTSARDKATRYSPEAVPKPKTRMTSRCGRGLVNQVPRRA